MTETSPVTFACYAHDSLDIRSSTIGFPADHTEVKLLGLFTERIHPKSLSKTRQKNPWKLICILNIDIINKKILIFGTLEAILETPRAWTILI